MNAWLSQHRAALALAFRRLLASPLNTLLSLVVIGSALAADMGCLNCHGTPPIYVGAPKIIASAAASFSHSCSVMFPS